MLIEKIDTRLSLTETKREQQIDIDLINNWFYNNKLLVNAEKTKLMVFKSNICYNNNNVQKIVLNSTSINYTKQYKYLGLIISVDLKWNSHIDKIIKKICPYVGVFRKLSKICSTQLYYSFIHSHLAHLTPIWCTVSLTMLNKLAVLQNKSIRLILNEGSRSRN